MVRQAKAKKKQRGDSLIYKFAEGSIHSVSAQIVGPILNRMGEEGRLTPKNVVEEARPEDSPLHPEFEWDNQIAAEKWREKQAQLLIAHTIIVEEGSSQNPVRAFHVTVEKGHYEPINLILQDETKRDTLLENAKRELIAFKKKYKILNELANVFAEIDKLTGENAG